MRPTISVIMPVYNSETYIKESLKSIIDQTFQNFEIIVIDDCSTDSTLLVLRENFKDKRLKIIKNEENQGITWCLNRGLELAKGKYIARMDADDLSDSNRFKEQVEFLENHKDVFLVGSSVEKIDENGNSLGFSHVLTDSKQIEEQLAIQNVIKHPTILFRNEGWKYREKFRYAQDYDFYLRLIDGGKKLSNIGKPLLKYRFTKTSISFSKTVQQKLFAKKAQEFHKERKRGNIDSYTDFDENEILEISSYKNSRDKELWQTVIFYKYRLGEYGVARQITLEYFEVFNFDLILLGWFLYPIGKRVAKIFK